jgi:hypothetical protein
VFAFSLANAFLQLEVMSSWLLSSLFNSSDVQFFMALSFSLLMSLFALCSNNRLLIAVRQTRKSVL